MQLLLSASNSLSNDACASELIDTVPLVMRVIRQHLRRHRSGLTIAQFRTLWHISAAQQSSPASPAGHSLSAVADLIGLSLPAMSRLVDGLVEQKLIKRRTCDQDRRHVRLSLTAGGEATLREARELAQAHIAQALAQLTSRQKASVSAAMQILRGVFTPELASEQQG